MRLAILALLALLTGCGDGSDTNPSDLDDFCLQCDPEDAHCDEPLVCVPCKRNCNIAAAPFRCADPDEFSTCGDGTY